MAKGEDLRRIVELAKKTLAPAALGVGLALSPGCGGEPEDPVAEDDLLDLEGKEDSIVNQCGPTYPTVDWAIFVKQKLTSTRMKKIASCAIEDLLLVEKCGIGCEATPAVALYMAPPTPAPVARYATPPADPNQPVALYAAPMPVPVCAADVNWIVKPGTYLTATKMKQLVQCASLAAEENCGIGCEMNGPVPLYAAPVTRYAAPIK